MKRYDLKTVLTTEPYNPKGVLIRSLGPKVTEQDREIVNRLMRQLSKKSPELGAKDLEDTTSQPNFQIVIIRNPVSREIIGMASIYYCKTLMHPKGKSHVEDVVIGKDHRGLGLGDVLMDQLIRWAVIKYLELIELTSNPKRKAANQLYIKFDFKKRKTNCYELDLS